ncbi:SIR2 family protein [Agrobacterium sp. S2]|nr:SIR2 family protein [Agrobacterium sp. S2]
MPTAGPLAAEIADLREASARGVAAVVTTNFDQVTDSLFPGFSVYRSQEELLMSTPYGGRELFKIHGCATDPDSMVLTKEDYVGFDRRSPYLSAKLLTLFAEHPVIFLGYSIDDPHIQQLLVDVASALSAANVAKLEGNLIFVRRDRSGAPSAITSSSFAIDGTAIPMEFVQVRDHEYGQVFEALKQLRPKLPTKVVAQLKSEVYRIIESEEPTQEIYTRDIESLDDDAIASQVEVVVGVGIRDQLGALGFHGVDRRHLLDDLVQPNPRLAGEKAAREVLDSVIPQINKMVYVPVFKYLARAGMLDALGNLKNDVDLDERVKARVATYEDRLKPSSGFGLARARRLAEAHPSVSALRSATRPNEVVEAVMSLERSTIDRAELLSFLSDQRNAHPTELSTSIARAICLYDYLTHGPGSVVPQLPGAIV